MRSVIFGIDGMAFRVINPLIERGELPNFKKLRDEGCEATLESKFPPLTPPAWVSLSTGLRPAKHGVYDFWIYDEEDPVSGERKASIQTHRLGGKAIWNILSEYGKQVLVINVPVTYPPEPINGIMVSGYMTPSTDVEFTYPASFKEELLQVVPDYEIDLNLQTMFDGDPDTLVDRLTEATLRMTEKRIKLIEYMLKEKPWDFCYLAFVGPDRIQHSLWDDIVALDARTNACYKQLDEALGMVLAQLGPDDTLFVVSDHGFQGITRSFDINEYLYSKGLLRLKSSTQRDKAARRAEIKHALQRTGLLSVARRLKKNLRKSGVLERKGADYYQPILEDMDREYTLAYVPSLSGFPGGYTDIVFHPDASPELVADIAEDLKRQVDPVTGKRLVDEIYTTEVYGEGPFALREPHLLVISSEGITFNMSLGNKHLWSDTVHVQGSHPGSHHKDGIFYAYGKGLRRGFAAPNATVFDLVPTLLRSMNLPLPHEFDGRILDELFVEKKTAEQATSATTEGSSSGKARKKLQKLLEI